MSRTAKPAAFTPRIEDPPPPKPKARPLGEWEVRITFVIKNAPSWCCIAEMASKSACGTQIRSLVKRYGAGYEFERREVDLRPGVSAFRIYCRLKATPPDTL
jgi:hypothetical protein